MSLTKSFQNFFTSLHGILATVLFLYVLKIRYEKISSDNKFEELFGSMKPESILLSSLEGFAFATVFFFIKTKTIKTNIVKNVAVESTMPIVVASLLSTSIDQYIKTQKKYEKFEFGHTVGIFVGTLLASKLF